MGGVPGVPLSILDLAPVSAGGDVATALRNTLDLARHADRLGYHRYWLAEHHFAPGVAAAAPAVLIAAVGAATSRIRVGSGAVQLGHQTAVAVVEQFGTLAGLYPDRVDLGLGRSGQRRAEVLRQADGGPPRAEPEPAAARDVGGLLIPAPFSFAKLLRSPRFAAQATVLQQPGARSPDYGEQVADILALIGGHFQVDGVDLHAVPGEGADVQVWILGSSGGQSAEVAGQHGLPFAANYHVSPATVLEAVEGYRDAFKSLTPQAKPHVMVSADVVVADTDGEARRLAAPYKLWVRSIRGGAGAIRFPSPAQAAEAPWTEEDQALVADRLDTQFVGSPGTVVDQLRTLQRVTGADELLVTTITHDHEDRVRSLQLLAEAWGSADVR